eukprot:gene3822-4412_t
MTLYKFDKDLRLDVLPLDHLSTEPLSQESLVKLTFGDEFSQPLGSYNLPHSLRYLKLGVAYQQPIGKFTFPASLIHLILGPGFVYSGEVLPETLTHLCGVHLGTGPGGSLLVLPPNLKHIRLSTRTQSNLSQRCKKLESISYDDELYIANRVISFSLLPNSVLRIHTGNLFNQPIATRSLPPRLTHMTFGDCFNQAILPGQLPQSLQYLHVGSDFSQPLVPGSIPESVTHFSCGDSFRQPLTRDLIPSVTRVTINFKHNLFGGINGMNDPAYMHYLTAFILSIIKLGGVIVSCLDPGSSSYINIGVMEKGTSVILATTPILKLPKRIQDTIIEAKINFIVPTSGVALVLSYIHCHDLDSSESDSYVTDHEGGDAEDEEAADDESDSNTVISNNSKRKRSPHKSPPKHKKSTTDAGIVKDAYAKLIHTNLRAHNPTISILFETNLPIFPPTTL